MIDALTTSVGLTIIELVLDGIQVILLSIMFKALDFYHDNLFYSFSF